MPIKNDFFCGCRPLFHHYINHKCFFSLQFRCRNCHDFSAFLGIKFSLKNLLSVKNIEILPLRFGLPLKFWGKEIHQIPSSWKPFDLLRQQCQGRLALGSSVSSSPESQHLKSQMDLFRFVFPYLIYS